MKLATLYKQASNGNIQEWTIEVVAGDPKARGGVELSGKVHHVNHGDPAQIITRYGQVGGKIQVASELISSGKNIGRANETSPYRQAQLEAEAQWEKKKKNKGYVETIEAAKAGERDASVLGGIDPMLAHKYSDHASKIVWPAYVQPKLDGHRCIAIIENGVCTLWSRQRKPITSMPHIVAELEKVFAGKTVTLDGELYNHDYRNDFEKLTKKIRPSKPVEGHEVVQYWVYDLAGEGGFGSRHQLLSNYFLGSDFGRDTSNTIVVVLTYMAEDEAGMVTLFDKFLADGFEGAMVRNAANTYKYGRSYDLQKVKEFQDAEFEIVDVVPGKAHMSDKGVFVCKTESGEEFKAKMVGELDTLRKFLDNKSDYIGKMLTVKFQKYSAKGVPVFGVGLRVREDV